MERPTIDPATGDALWQPNGARQRYAKRFFNEVEISRILAAAGQIMRHQMVERGEIGPHDGVSIQKADFANWIQWCNLGQLKVIRRIAEGLVGPEVISTH
jgi:hypothetical protein